MARKHYRAWPWVTFEYAARRLKVTPPQLQKIVQQKEVWASQPGGLMARKSIEELLKQQSRFVRQREERSWDESSP